MKRARPKPGFSFQPSILAGLWVCAAISYPVVTLERRVMEDVCLGLVVLVFGAERIAGDAFDFGFAEGLVVVLAPDIDRDIWAAEACGEAVISDGTEGAAAFAGLARVIDGGLTVSAIGDGLAVLEKVWVGVTIVADGWVWSVGRDFAVGLLWVWEP